LNIKYQEIVALDKDYVYQHHWWRGQKVIREGVSEEHWDLRIDFGKDIPELLHFVLTEDILKTKQSQGYIKPCLDKSSMEFEGYAKPGTPLNPTKDTPAYVSIETKGKVNILINKDDFKKFEFKTGELKGLYIANKIAENQWVIKESELPETV